VKAEHDRPAELTPWAKVEGLLTVLSHDLRSPLSALSVGVDALAEIDLDDDTRTRYLAAMRRAIGRAERVLADLLDVGRIAAGTFEVMPSPVEVAPLLRCAARDHEEEAQENGTWIVVDPAVNGGLRRVYADSERILQALDKLICNATRHARGSGEIMLRAENQHAAGGDTVRLWVIDRGPGIPLEELDGIFERCWGGGTGPRRGSGLGLALAKGIAEAHGGQMRVESEPGKGAQFCMELPVHV